MNWCNLSTHPGSQHQVHSAIQLYTLSLLRVFTTISSTTIHGISTASIVFTILILTTMTALLT